MSTLFQKFVAGDEDAYAIYFRRYYAGVYASIKRLCGDDHLAQDLTQDVFKHCWDRRADFRNETHLGSRLFYMVRIYFLQYLRERKLMGDAEEELHRSATTPEEDAIDFILVKEESFLKVERALMKLPPQQKLITELLLRGLDVKTVAKMLRLAEQTIRNHKNAAIQSLRNEL